MEASLRLYRLKDFASTHGIGLTRVYDEIKSGRLKSVKCGKRRLIPAEAAEAWRRSLMAQAESVAA
jgi:excisionase family DNA binding protein